MRKAFKQKSRIDRLVGNSSAAKGLLGGLSYFEYEYLLGERVLIPWISRHMSLEGISVGDFGCHQGGVLQAFQQKTGAASGVGFEIDPHVLAASPFKSDLHFFLKRGDILDPETCPFSFDLILLADVLEHIPFYFKMLNQVKRYLRPGGRIFVSFPPYFSPFGGHQHVAANWARVAPYLHLLPTRWFFGFLCLKDNVYMGAEQLRKDLAGIRKTRLTLGRFETALNKLGLTVRAKALYLARPEFEIRYKISAKKCRWLGHVPIVREFLTTGAYYLLSFP